MQQGLYIHIPFCVSKCNYCDFISYAQSEDFMQPYIQCVIKEAAFYKDLPKPQTLYIGGGTPSLLPVREMDTLFKGISRVFGDTRRLSEVTFECNPESITEEKLKYLKAFGVTRLSIGMQTTCAEHLKLIGRAHTREQFFESYELASKYFDNINIDIIAALPQQTLADFEYTVQEVVNLNPRHISVYGLQVEEGTKLYEDGYQTDDDLCRKMLEHAAKYLALCGYEQYEISNYSKPGFECLHNINYWQNGPYIGLGVAAAAYIDGERRQNTNDLEEYIACVMRGQNPVKFSETLEGKAKMGESILLGLRMMEGILPTQEMQEVFAKDFNKLIDEGLLELINGRLRLSEEGKYMANRVFSRFVEPF